jgi:hypothetical protein
VKRASEPTVYSWTDFAFGKMDGFAMARHDGVRTGVKIDAGWYDCRPLASGQPLAAQKPREIKDFLVTFFQKSN